MAIPQQEFPYLIPPYIFKGWKWLIVWEEYIPGTTVKKRVRKTFDLNRSHFITDPVARQARADMILQEKTREYQDASRQKAVVAAVLGNTNIVEALHVALKFKLTTDREHTKITYTSFTNIFCQWLREKGWEHLRISDFDRLKATVFMDYILLDRKDRHGNRVGNRTYNNYVLNMRSLFYELVHREYIQENPFSNRKPRKEEDKLRHPFEQADSNLIADYVYKHNRVVYLAILLISHCGLRLQELRRLRRRDIDLERGMIILGGNQTKNKERAYITIPATVLPLLESFDLGRIAPAFLIFGANLKPHPKVACGRNTISSRFREMLDKMVSQGLLRSREGYTAYSWKDTGAIAMVKGGVDILAIQKHLRHKSLATTQRYLQSLGVINRDVRDFKGVIFELPDLEAA